MKQSTQIQKAFREDLIRVQNNLINNFKLLQDTINTNLQQIHLKTSIMEDKIMGILHTKEKVILRINNSIQTLGRNLLVVEQSIASLASRGDVYSTIQTHVGLRIQKFTREFSKRMDQIETENNRIQEVISSDLNNKLGKNSFDLMKNKLESLEAKIQDSKPISNYNSNDEVSSIRQQIKDLNKLISKIIEDNSRHERKIKNIQENSFRSVQHVEATTQRKNSFINKQDNIPAKYISDTTPDKKSIQKKQQPIESMEVGLKALRKSKEKRQQYERQASIFEKDNRLLFPQSILQNKKDLPPLIKQQNFQSRKAVSTIEPSEESAEFYVDEYGYVVDKDGVRIRDQMGNEIQYTEDLQQYQEQDQY